MMPEIVKRAAGRKALHGHGDTFDAGAAICYGMGS